METFLVVLIFAGCLLALFAITLWKVLSTITLPEEEVEGEEEEEEDDNNMDEENTVSSKESNDDSEGESDQV